MTAVEVARWAFTVSALSLVIALASFIWNVWSKFIYPRPRLQVIFGVNTLIPVSSVGTLGEDTRRLTISATNHGPGTITMKATIVKYRQHGQVKIGHLIPLTDAVATTHSWHVPGDGSFPRKLEQGEAHTFYFNPDRGIFERGVIAVGVMDSYARNHWAPRGEVLKARRDLRP